MLLLLPVVGLLLQPLADGLVSNQEDYEQRAGVQEEEGQVLVLEEVDTTDQRSNCRKRKRAEGQEECLYDLYVGYTCDGQ